MKPEKTSLLVLVFVLSIPQVSFAQEQVIKLYQGPSPGSENWDWQEAFIEQANMAYNIVSPTLTVYAASPESAPGNQPNSSFTRRVDMDLACANKTCPPTNGSTAFMSG